MSIAPPLSLWCPVSWSRQVSYSWGPDSGCSCERLGDDSMTGALNCWCPGGGEVGGEDGIMSIPRGRFSGLCVLAKWHWSPKRQHPCLCQLRQTVVLCTGVHKSGSGVAGCSGEAVAGV